MHAVSIVADDLTGAMDTAQGFAVRGHGAAVMVVPQTGSTSGISGRDGVPESPILGVNTDTRYDDADRAADAVTDVVNGIPAETVYKKVDSTLRGNVGAETDAALAASGADLALFAPAFPDAGRTTRDGVHYVDGTPVDETEYGADEKGPSSSALADIFEGYDRPLVYVPARVVEAGREGVSEALADAVEHSARPPVVLCDARDADDLATIADAGRERDVLYVGSGGLAAHVTVPTSTPDSAGDTRSTPVSSGTSPESSTDPTSESSTAPSREPSQGAPLGVVGSVSATTLAQLKRVPDEYVIELDPVTLLTESTVEDAARRATDRLSRGQPVLLTAATDRETVDRTVEAGRERGLAPGEIRNRVASGLAATAAATVESETPSGLFYTGGDVAVAGLRALDATTVTLTADAIEAGIPIGRLADGVSAGIPLITKAGGFGTEATIVNCLERLFRDDE